MNDRRIQQNSKNRIICFPLIEISDVVKLVVEKGKAGMESGILPPISAEFQLFCPLLEHLLPALFLREPEMAIKERCREENSSNPIDCFWKSITENVKTLV